ncbi:MAG: thioredoxin domain-containing protein [Streptomycetales bacterium]
MSGAAVALAGTRRHPPVRPALAWAGTVGGWYSAFAGCVRERRYDGWMRQAAIRAQDRGVRATPTVYVDGQELARADYTAEGLRRSVRGATR